MNITVKFLSTPSARRATFRAGMLTCWKCYFYPRPPRGGRHSPCVAWEQGHSISIHVLREEGDSAPVLLGRLLHNFYPRPPRGGRLIAKVLAGRCAIFLSTPSARRATRKMRKARRRSSISIHALREEGDDWFFTVDNETELFLSTPSARRATGTGDLKAASGVFLSTPSARRATQFRKSK